MSAATSPRTGVFVEMHVPDLKKASKFYILLGFKVMRTEKEYLVMRKGRSELNFFTQGKRSHSYFGLFPPDTKRGYGVEIVLVEKDVKRPYKKIRDKVKIVGPLALRPWGWDFRIEDPFGFYLRIGER